MAEPLRKTTALGNPEQASDYLRLWLRDKPHEVFVVLLLDSQLRLMQSQELFRGTVSQAAVYPREVVRQAMQCNASAVIVAHNHPSGVAEPSAGDLSLTRSLAQALALLDIRLLDHLIVAGPQVVSLAQRGLL
jgi:DNA repair protein RadC